MLKKYIVLGMLSLACSAAYADGHSTLDVADSVKNQSFHINDINFTYQFNNNADDKSKPMQFSLTVDQNSSYGVHVQCFHKMEQPVQEFDILPGKTGGCSTNDAVRLVQIKNGNATGNYSITLGQ